MWNTRFKRQCKPIGLHTTGDRSRFHKAWNGLEEDETISNQTTLSVVD